jgi:hypothetical protein
MRPLRVFLLVLPLSFLGVGCQSPSSSSESEAGERASRAAASSEALVGKYTPVRLDADVSGLSDDQKEMVRLFIEAAQAMDGIFWEQAYGDRDSLLQTINDPRHRRFVDINYGPWDRLDDNEPFIDGVGPKPAGANFYPEDMTKDEFEQAAQTDDTLDDLYTMVRRLPDGSLTALPYHRFFAAPMETAASRLQEASALAENESFGRYLERRAEALTTGDYRPSDRAWMDVTGNDLDLVIGPIETYEDQLFGYKAAAEAFVLRKDRAWSRRLSRYAELLPMLQEGLPVPAEYKQESPGRDSDLGAYEVLYVSGDANAGPKTIAINLPNDEAVQQEKGSRRLQLKNAMRAKFDEILMPIAEVLIAEEQRPNVTFDAFFGNTMFHEVAHGLGIKNTITGRGTVREALKDHYTTMEEGKADVLGLYMVKALADEGELDVTLMDNYASFLAGIFRSVRFGSASAHGRANLIRFNYFREQGAFSRDADTGTYAVNSDAMMEATNALSREILTLQGDGDYESVASFVEEYATMPEQLQADLDRLDDEGIPVDITYEQGRSVLTGMPPATAAR